MSSEVVFKKNKYVVSELFNLMQSLLIKHGLKGSTFVVLINSLINLKKKIDATQKDQLAILSTSPYSKLHDFVSRHTPRINVISVETKKTDESIKTPMPPMKRSLLRHNFVVKYVGAARKEKSYKAAAGHLADAYQELFALKKSKFVQDLDNTYTVLNQFRFRVKKRHDKLMKKKKIVSNVVTKSKQSYL